MLLWTNGAITEGPELRDVPRGIYAAVPLPARSGGTAQVVTVHTCPPAEVSVVPSENKIRGLM